MKPAPGSSQADNTASNQPIDKSRRLLLKMMGIGAGVTASKITAANDIAGELIQASKYLIGGINITLYRPQDLLELDITISGFTRSADYKSLTRSGSPTYMRVEFAPQSIQEQAYLEGSTPSFPAKTFLSGKSRLVFEIPSSITSIPLTAKGLLDWDKFRLVVNKRAQTSVVFSVQDNIGNYNNILLKDVQVIGTQPINTNTQPVNNDRRVIQPVNNNNRVLDQPVDRKPVDGSNTRPLNNTRPIIRGQQPQTNSRDTARRQVQVNREMRGATRDEQKVISAREMPVDAKAATNSNIVGALINLKMGKTPRPVDEDETAIEFPYRIFISPNQYAAWVHDFKLKLREDLQTSVSKTYELWHSRLTCKNCDNEKDQTGATNPLKTVRALWAVDANGAWNKLPATDLSFVTSINNAQRHQIVHESSNFDLGGFSPKPVRVNNLMLSSLGAWFDGELTVERDALSKGGVLGALTLTKWKHIATLARDHYVEIVEAGNMWPFGHEASIVTITERKPENNYALNRQRKFIIINEPEKKYNPYNPDNGNFRSFPFSTIKIVNTVTPSLAPGVAFNPELPSDRQFIPTTIEGEQIKFKLVGYDLDGNEVDFEMPLVFVSTAMTYNPGSDGKPVVPASPNLVNIGKIGSTYNAGKVIDNTISFRNQKMSLTRSSTPGDATFEVQTVAFSSQAVVTEEPFFRPGVKELSIFIAAVENITGKREAQKVKLVDDEMNKPESQRKNKGKVFAELVKTAAVSFDGNGNKTGGSVSPNFSITALSKSLGAIGGDINQAQRMNFDPTKFFDSSAKLFGVIELKSIISAVEGASAIMNGDSVKSPFPALKNIETKDANITQYIWSGGKLKNATLGIVGFDTKGSGENKIVIETNLYRYKDPAKPNTLTVNSTLSNFAITLAGIAAVDFKKIGFYTGSNAKVDFTVEMAETPLRFLGALSFVNDLQKYIPADGFSDPPFLDISTSGIRTGYTLALPDIQLGAFTLRHINLGAAITLPFTGAPMSIRFNFCEKQQPFTLTVSGLGGGGFFAIEFDMNGLRALEAALEFGAAVSINLGVASGAVSIMGGIYFLLSINETTKEKEYRLEGYVRVNGALCVLGLITA
ncbi:MAG TPA: hypothetical protein VHM26_11215, partial [Chitinophagaceae bacterium]|nr:hypothetical protein [Chitinophagaceae bacterium]